MPILRIVINSHFRNTKETFQPDAYEHFEKKLFKVQEDLEQRADLGRSFPKHHGFYFDNSTHTLGIPNRHFSTWCIWAFWKNVESKRGHSFTQFWRMALHRDGPLRPAPLSSHFVWRLQKVRTQHARWTPHQAGPGRSFLQHHHFYFDQIWKLTFWAINF